MNELHQASQFLYLYTTTNDLKLLYHMMSHSYLALREKIKPLAPTFEEQLLRLQTTDPDAVRLILTLHKVKQQKKEATIEITKDDKLIFLDKKYTPVAYHRDEAIDFFEKAKIFIEKPLPA